jgi:hypothetical protein
MMVGPFRPILSIVGIPKMVGFNLGQPYNSPMMATTLEKELRLIRERLDSIEETLGEEMSEDDKKAKAEALREHREGKTVPFVRKHNR